MMDEIEQLLSRQGLPHLLDVLQQHKAHAQELASALEHGQDLLREYLPEVWSPEIAEFHALCDRLKNKSKKL